MPSPSKRGPPFDKRGERDVRMSTKPFLAITLGDPAGIGPWVGALAAGDRSVRRRCRPVLVGDASVLRRFLRGFAVRPLADLDDFVDGRALNVLHVPHP